MSYSRPVSAVEVAWLAAHTLYPPFVNCLVLTGSGSVDEAMLRAAVRDASAVNPGLRVRMTGRLWRRRWVDGGEAPPVHVVPNCTWDGQSLDGAPFIDGALDPVAGPTADVWLLAGSTPRLVFRTLHAVTDGMGIMQWVADVFRCLRGEAPLGQPDTTTEDALVAASPGSKRPPPRDEAIAPTGSADGEPRGVVWGHRTVQGSARGLLAGVIRQVADQAQSTGVDGVVRIEVPVDLRRHGGQLRASGNLSGSVVLDVSPEHTAAQIGELIKTSIAQGHHLDGIRTLGFLRALPLWLVARVGRAGGAKQAKAERYGSSAVVSNMGRYDLTDWTGGGFAAEHCVMVPPGSNVTPAFIGIMGSQAGLTFMVTMPEHLATGGRFDGFIHGLCAVVSDAP